MGGRGGPEKQVVEKLGVRGGSQGRIKARLGKVTEEAIRQTNTKL